MDTGTSPQSAVDELARLEEQLARALSLAREGIARSEDLDQEQRSEIYSILQAMTGESEAGRDVPGKWVNDVTGEVADV